MQQYNCSLSWCWWRFRLLPLIADVSSLKWMRTIWSRIATNKFRGTFVVFLLGDDDDDDCCCWWWCWGSDVGGEAENVVCRSAAKVECRTVKSLDFNWGIILWWPPICDGPVVVVVITAWLLGLPLPLPLLLELGFFLFRDCFFLPILVLVRRYYKYIYICLMCRWSLQVVMFLVEEAVHVQFRAILK